MAEAKIFLVEDNEALRRALKKFLELDGYQVTSASHGQEALDKMQNETPDLIISDISMPLMDGISFFDAVRTRPEWLAIPFIFLTALGDRQDIFNSRKLGAEDYLVKPVNQQELLATVHSRLARSQQLLLAKLQQAYEMSLIMLANAIELRDIYTRGHVERVLDYTLIIARKIADLPETQLRTLKLGSILHDIGKIHISEHILHKPGPLNDEEWVEMKRHPVVGSELIRNISYLESAMPIIRHHHERWDGKGYPDGLSGDEIPMEARIVAVADSLDAMTISRVYQAACEPEEARERIDVDRGQRYDPVVVDALHDAWPEIKNRFMQNGHAAPI